MTKRNPVPTVFARDLTKQFGTFTAVDGIDFEVPAGEIFGFLGPNGSGKTTTIRMMLGLLPPTRGIMEVLGISVREHPDQIRPRVGYMAQQFSLYRDLSVTQNLRFHGSAYGLSNLELEQAIELALGRAGLSRRGQVKTSELSGGWRQRLALSAAILHKPEVLFLDEPTAGVDPISRREFWELLYILADEGVTIFVTTHYMDEAEHCHRLALIQRGRLIATGTPEELKQTTLKGRVLELQPSDTAAAIRALRDARDQGRLDIREVELYGALLHVVAGKMKQKKKEILKVLEQAGVDPGTANMIEPSLEDVFIACMK